MTAGKKFRLLALLGLVAFTLSRCGGDSEGGSSDTVTHPDDRFPSGWDGSSDHGGTSWTISTVSQAAS